MAAESGGRVRVRRLSGFSFIGGQGPSYGSYHHQVERLGRPFYDAEFGYCGMVRLFMRAQKIIKDAQVLFFAPPMIPGYSASSDIELNMQDKTGGRLGSFLMMSSMDYMAALKARPEINSAQTTFNPNFPQYDDRYRRCRL